jgi:hypothetical protein
MAHIRWQGSLRDHQMPRTQTEPPQVSNLPVVQIQWHRTAIRTGQAHGGRAAATPAKQAARLGILTAPIGCAPEPGKNSRTDAKSQFKPAKGPLPPVTVNGSMLNPGVQQSLSVYYGPDRCHIRDAVSLARCNVYDAVRRRRTRLRRGLRLCGHPGPFMPPGCMSRTDHL